MRAFEISEIRTHQDRSRALYHEFLRVPALSCGVYTLRAGTEDPQAPHAEDEVYCVVRGRGSIRVGSEDREVRRGSVVFVAAHAEHRFHSIREDLSVLVFFAPAEGSKAKRALA